ncbi:MAG: long-chain fatty acid--CoA ligase [Leptolyngbyaceae bacterium]|nr:long-chain fatty acid--CoA ligase [Leptolyngbyaceae bacterium]
MSNLSVSSYSSLGSLSELWPHRADIFGDEIVALHDPHSSPERKLTYKQLYQQITQFAAGLQSLGVAPGDRIALFSDNSPLWFIADQGIMAAGAVNAVRSSQADRDELIYIYGHSGSMGLVAENWATYQKIQEGIGDRPLAFVILLSGEPPEDTAGVKVLTIDQLLQLGSSASFHPVQRQRDDLATLIYTSGTSGRPKGVMLSHGNLLFQIEAATRVVQPVTGDRVLSLLPSWHSYERTFEYFVLAQGCTQIYTSIRFIKQDLKTYKPHYMVGVPRIWESIYEGIQKQFREQPEKKQKLIQFFLSNSQRFIDARRTLQRLNLDNLKPSLADQVKAVVSYAALAPIHALGDRIVYRKIREATGGQVKYLISGGGSFAKHLDNFFEIINVQILQGYGLTETSPITNVRVPHRNIRGTSGPPVYQTEIRIVDPESRTPLKPGEKGLILIRGPQVMQGYYQNPEATQKAISPDGWFDSGDLGWMTDNGDLTITGRAKDTIVLTNGENIEPQPIEDACARSAYIDQIMLVGQDQKFLGALIVPNLEALEKWADSQQITLESDSSGGASQGGTTQVTTASTVSLSALSHPAIQTLFRKELNREVKNRPGYRPDDRIAAFQFLPEPFSIENGMMTQTLKIRRNVVMERYRGMIDAIYDQ